MGNPVTVDLLASDAAVDDFARVIARAFANYPVMKRAFADYPNDREDWIFRMICLSANARRASGGPIPVARMGDRLVGGANITLPNFSPDPSAHEWFSEFLDAVGPTAKDFFPRFFAAIEAITLPKPHTYLTMIGVDPEFQGQGIGRQLIEEVVEMSRVFPDCKGIALDTQAEANVSIYETCGFSVVGEAAVDDLPIWVMWRPLS